MPDPESSAPVEPGEEYTVEIEEFGREGDGVATVEDFVVLVPDADLGERVLVRIDTVEDDFATATRIEE